MSTIQDRLHALGPVALSNIRRGIETLAEDLMRESLGEHTFKRLMEKSRK